jgi:hypothetical protein
MSTAKSYGRVAKSWWNDPEFEHALSARQKLLLLYYFTGPASNMIGLYRASFASTAEVLGDTTAGEVKEWTLGALSSAVAYDEHTREVFVYRALRHQVSDVLKPGDNRLKSIERMLADAHSDTLVRMFFDLYPDLPIDRSRAGKADASTVIPFQRRVSGA